MNYPKIPMMLALAAVLSVLAGCASSTETSLHDAYKDVAEAKLYADGTELLEHHSYRQAAEKFEALETNYPFGKHVEEAQLNLIYAHQQLEEYQDAEAAADRYLHLYPRSKRADYALYMRALARLENSGSWLQKRMHTEAALRDMAGYRKAFADLKTLLAQHPKSEYRTAAIETMHHIRNVMAEHELRVAQFYFSHQSYVAAANRAQSLLKTYPKAPQTQVALELLYQANQKLTLDKAAADVQTVITRNFPDSAYASA